MSDRTPGRNSAGEFAGEGTSQWPLGSPLSSGVARCNVTRGQIATNTPIVSRTERPYATHVDPHLADQEIGVISSHSLGGATCSSESPLTKQQHRTFSHRISPPTSGHPFTPRLGSTTLADDDVFLSQGQAGLLSYGYSQEEAADLSITRTNTNTLFPSQHGDLNESGKSVLGVPSDRLNYFAPRPHRSTGDIYDLTTIRPPDTQLYRHVPQGQSETGHSTTSHTSTVAASTMQARGMNAPSYKTSPDTARAYRSHELSPPFQSSPSTPRKSPDTNRSRAVSPQLRKIPSYLVKQELGPTYMPESPYSDDENDITSHIDERKEKTREHLKVETDDTHKVSHSPREVSHKKYGHRSRSHRRTTDPMLYTEQNETDHMTSSPEKVQGMMTWQSEALSAKRMVRDKVQEYLESSAQNYSPNSSFENSFGANRPTYLGLADIQSISRSQLKTVKLSKNLASFNSITPCSSRRTSFSSIVSTSDIVGKDIDLELDEDKCKTEYSLKSVSPKTRTQTWLLSPISPAMQEPITDSRSLFTPSNEHETFQMDDVSIEKQFTPSPGSRFSSLQPPSYKSPKRSGSEDFPEYVQCDTSAITKTMQPPKTDDDDEGIGTEHNIPVGTMTLRLPKLPDFKMLHTVEKSEKVEPLLSKDKLCLKSLKVKKYMPINRKESPADSSLKSSDRSDNVKSKRNGDQNGGNGCTNGRSRSDPTQDRKRLPEESENVSRDSNLLSSLNVGACPSPEGVLSDGSDISISTIGDSMDQTYTQVYESVVSEPSGISDHHDTRNGKNKKKLSLTWPNGDSAHNNFIPVQRQPIQSASSEPVIPEVEQEVDGDEDIIEPLKLSFDEEKDDDMKIDKRIIGLSLPSTATATQKRKERMRKSRSEDKESGKKPKVSIVIPENIPEPPLSPGTLKKSPSIGKDDLSKHFTLIPKVSCKTISTPNLTVMQQASVGDELGSPATPTTVLTESRSSASLPRNITSISPDKKPTKQNVYKREVMSNFLSAEKSYVRSLETLETTYMKPLKRPENAGIVEAGMVDVIFHKIPEILESHRRFLQQLDARIDQWNDKRRDGDLIIGDLIIACFTKQRFLDDYLAFVDNYRHSKDCFKELKESKPSFRQFLENCSRKNKFTFDDMIIQPVQRIPRYVLLIQDLLKHTSSDHPDYTSLKDALEKIQKLAKTINDAKNVEKNLEVLQDIDSMVEGNADLVIPGREFLKQFPVNEMVQKANREVVLKKTDRAIFLFSDLLMCTSVKRKSGRASISVFHPNLIMEASKYKLLWKHHLDDVEVVKPTHSNRRASIERLISQWEEDLNVLNQINDLSGNLNHPHESLDAALNELMSNINKKLTENRIPVMSPTFPAKEVELQATTPDGLDSHILVFTDLNMRITWEMDFNKAKQKLADSKDTFPPKFLKPIPISKTRSGMQFSCASPAPPAGLEEQREVWVCNSDGYVGQVCLLKLAPKPEVDACKTVCSARILCIAPIPATQRIPTFHRIREANRNTSVQSPISINVIDEDCIMTSPPQRKRNKQAASIIAFDSDNSDDGATKNYTTLQYDEEDLSSDEDDDGGLTIHKINDVLDDDDDEDPDNLKATMWLGTEDGCIHIYICNNTVRKDKAATKIQHAAAVQCIIYLDNKVFAALANGELVMYSRQPGSPWDFDNPQTLTMRNSNAPITKMAAVTGKLWFGRQNLITVLDANSVMVEKEIQVSSEQNHSVQCMVTSGLGVWVSLSQQSSAVVKVYHATNYSNLMDVDITQAVHKMLAGSDAIIRQHKAACLRITALLMCKDLLWVGTSAGVVLTLPLPKITSTLTSLQDIPPVTGSGHGHTGHVRFLSAVEMLNDDDDDEDSPPQKVKFQRRTSVSALMMPKMLVISGGDGYEDFCSTSSNEAAGRDDSTNHLLLWKV